MSRWLDDFAYRIEISPGLFLTAGAMLKNYFKIAFRNLRLEMIGKG